MIKSIENGKLIIEMNVENVRICRCANVEEVALHRHFER
jgi:hypothetical protein